MALPKQHTIWHPWPMPDGCMHMQGISNTVAKQHATKSYGVQWSMGCSMHLAEPTQCNNPSYNHDFIPEVADCAAYSRQHRNAILQKCRRL